MRVLEVCLRRLGSELGIPDPVGQDRNWGNMLRTIHTAVQQRSDAKEKSFYQEIETMLTAVKTSWRNPTMHVEGVYVQEQAEDIFSVVKSFVRKFAEGLNVPKTT